MWKATIQRRANTIVVKQSEWIGVDSIQNNNWEIEMWCKFGKNWVVCKQIRRRSLVSYQKN